jgi:hypothetical protein
MNGTSPSIPSRVDKKFPFHSQPVLLRLRPPRAYTCKWPRSRQPTKCRLWPFTLDGPVLLDQTIPLELAAGRLLPPAWRQVRNTFGPSGHPPEDRIRRSFARGSYTLLFYAGYYSQTEKG